MGRKHWREWMEGAVVEYGLGPEDEQVFRAALERTRQTLLPWCEYCGRALRVRHAPSRTPIYEICTCDQAVAECSAREARRSCPVPQHLPDGRVIEGGHVTHVMVRGEYRRVRPLDEALAAVLPENLHRSRWERFSHAGEHGQAVQCAQEWSALVADKRERGVWLYVYGDNGCGKSSALACLVRDALTGYRDVTWLDWHELVTLPFDEGRLRATQAMRADLLVIDEFGKGRQGEWAASLAALVINHRANNRLTTALASNYRVDDLGKAYGDDGLAVADRLTQLCTALDFNGCNYRRMAA